MKTHRNGVQLNAIESRIFFGTPKGEKFIRQSDPDPLETGRRILRLLDAIQRERTDEQFIILDRHRRAPPYARTREELVSSLSIWGEP